VFYLCPRHNRDEVKGRGSLGPVGIHGNRCRGVLGDRRGCDGRCLRGLLVAAATVGAVDELQMQHLCLELADGSQLRPPRQAIGSPPHMALQGLEDNAASVEAEEERERERERESVGWDEETEPANQKLLCLLTLAQLEAEQLEAEQLEAEQLEAEGRDRPVSP